MKLGKKGSIYTKEGKHMAVSKAIVPLLKGKAATKIVDDFKKSKFIPATTTDRENPIHILRLLEIFVVEQMIH